MIFIHYIKISAGIMDLVLQNLFEYLSLGLEFNLKLQSNVLCIVLAFYFSIP